MASLSDIEQIPLAGYKHIDALLGSGPDWNFQTGTANTIYYSFRLDNSDRRQAQTAQSVAEFGEVQKAAARHAFEYVASVTGIHFVEASDPAQAQLHLWSGDLVSKDAAGIYYWKPSYETGANGAITSYDAEAWLYLGSTYDPVDYARMAPGTLAYHVLLNEIGHALGLKFASSGDIRLPAPDDNTLNTVMSTTYRGPLVAELRPYDLAALNWLYGGDGLAGKLGINSSGGGRYLMGTARDDTLQGGAGNDLLEGLQGNDKLDGSGGLDHVRYSDARAGHVVSKQADGSLVTAAAGQLGSDELHNVERLAFTDMNVALDIDGVAGQAYRMYQAGLGRTPDAGGLGYWIEMMDRGMTLRELAANFMATPEFIGKFGGSNPEDAVFVTKVYNNVLHRTPDEGGFRYFMDALAAGNSKIDMLAAFSESPENQAQLIGVIGNGIDYKPFI
jgi:Ca2+-binding RTX toxin-like protein